MKKKFFISLTIFAILLCTSCQSINKNIPAVPLDYTNEDVVKNEIQNINKIMGTEPVKALWRAVLLGREDVIKNCTDNLVLLFEDAIENKKYFEAKKYYKSLTTIGWKSSKYTEKEVNAICSKDIPGLSGENNKAPKTIAECMDATVTIWVDRGLKLENGAGYADIVLGSGFFIDKRGYIITNHHVIESMVDPKYEGYSRLYIKLLDDQDTKIPAKVIGYDPILDLALLKVEIEPKYVLNLGSSKDLKIGDKISAIGTPIGLEGTLTSGIISSTDRKLTTLGNVFQIDAAVNSGNSGGPLIDEKMHVQAIVFAGMLQFQGLNFAIPVEYLKQELNSLYSNEMVIHPWIACYGHTKRNGKNKVGLEIQYVMPGGSAILAGLKPGDVITEIDGNPIKSLEDYQYLMMGYEFETILNCKYIDSNEEMQEKLIYLDIRPESPGLEIYKSDFANENFVPFFGMRMVNSSTLSRNSYTITEIIKGSTADEMNFSQNDPITVKEIKIDKEHEYIFAQIIAKRKKNGFMDIILTLSTSFDNPYYF